jgi:hypothetical protein
MATSESSNSSYHVLWSPRAQKAIRKMVVEAPTPTLRQRILQAVRQLDKRMRHDPCDVGEVYRVKGPVAEHLAVHDCLAIDFAVDMKRKVALVRLVNMVGIQAD